MKQTTKKITALFLAALMLFAFASCKSDEAPEGSLWDNAIYTEDTEIGEGTKTLSVKVTAGERSIMFTIKSDAETVGDALLENELVEGSEGPFGLYISHVNGIKAVYEEDSAYWAFHDNDGALMSVGVDSANFLDGETYELRYTEA